jgi:hypothetical protein
MANPYLPETLRGIAATNKLQIATLIGELSQSVVILTADIQHQEARAGINNLAHLAYPVLARNLRARRKNIEATIASLKALTRSAPKAA